MGRSGEDDRKIPIYPPPAPGIPAMAPMYTEMPSAPPNFLPPPYHLQPPQGSGKWSVGLCDCCGECGVSCGFNGALYCLIAAVTGCACVYSCIYRKKMREQYRLEGSTCGDLCTHCCCEPCALTQQYRELQNRGFDVSIGWQGNVQRQMPPAVPGGMQR
ncbi:hypothetical protein SAY87_015911 [Trapa incisa]|uniref:Uncharacterized protein n=1 Tax=Trapa incisa TaxID=236973 RepID=A0AAN7L7I7_9MYRT|nr:hypothetical protein SAY87_015911 [Trapa incisa]